MEATAGSLTLLGAKSAEESSVATRLRAAGTIFLGKINMSEWAYYRPNNPWDRWSLRGGQYISPESRNNVVGFRPTTGLVARDGVIPASYQQDTVGALSRTVKDAAHSLTLIAGKGPLDARNS